jgi:hypothetical protein
MFIYFYAKHFNLLKVTRLSVILLIVSLLIVNLPNVKMLNVILLIVILHSLSGLYYKRVTIIIDAPSVVSK